MKQCIIALRMLLVLTVLTGLVYPFFVTITAQLAFGQKANGSLITENGRSIGSIWIAQKFTNTTYVWPRPSAGDYATVASGASNKGPTSTDLKQVIEERATALRSAHGLAVDAPVPAELLFASGSGLDPHLSPEAVRFQMERIAIARKFNAQQKDNMTRLVESLIELPQWGFLGEPRVNVLKLNLALDKLP